MASLQSSAILPLVAIAISFISADNLTEILGDEFAREEIDAIIEEATGSKEKKISYADFLKLWEVKHEERREKIIQELSYVNDDNSSVGSFGSDTNLEEEAKARATFIGKKIASEAKIAKRSSLSDQAAEELKKMVLEEGAIIVLDDHKEAEV